MTHLETDYFFHEGLFVYRIQLINIFPPMCDVIVHKKDLLSYDKWIFLGMEKSRPIPNETGAINVIKTFVFQNEKRDS